MSTRTINQSQSFFQYNSSLSIIYQMLNYRNSTQKCLEDTVVCLMIHQTGFCIFIHIITILWFIFITHIVLLSVTYDECRLLVDGADKLGWGFQSLSASNKKIHIQYHTNEYNHQYHTHQSNKNECRCSSHSSYPVHQMTQSQIQDRLHPLFRWATRFINHIL